MMHPKFSLLRLLRDTNSWFAAETVGRMEKLILCALEWRTRSITPFAFLRYFLASNSAPSSISTPSLGNEPSPSSPAPREGDGYKPSVVAAASLLSAASDLFPAQFAAFRSAVRACIFLDKVTLEACFDALEEDKAERNHHVDS
uniref:Cyclin C-terminal domain-containing protein n=1 Tax=Ananas comosus var. bracteatus TaxID=296719 RepID=A0A6V7PMT3_ANACO|nr:unnamed protein product [Ananas comosus var. bracteatus]